MVQQWRTIGERVLSGRGTFRFPVEDFASLRAISIFVDVTRKPKSDYLSKKTEPNRSFYGYITLQSDDYVLQELSINYPKQRFDFYTDNTGIIQKMLPCINQEILQSLINLGIALGVPPVSIQNETQDWNLVNFAPKLIQFCMFSSSAVRVLVKGLDYDDCEELESDSEQEEPPPPELPDFLDPDEPADISEPYQDDTSNNYDPFPGDAPPEPEPPERTCDSINLGQIRIEGVTTFGTPFVEVVNTNTVLGGVDPTLIQIADNKLAVLAYGGGFNALPCGNDLVEVQIVQAPGNYIIQEFSFVNPPNI